MNYKVEILENKPLTVARMKMTIPDYSTDLDLMAVNTMKNELKRKGVEPLDTPYDFSVSYDSTYRIEVIDVEINVGVKSKGEDSEINKFVELPFEDIYIALAEWMHDNDYVADGGLRTIIHSGREFIYDCPVKPAGD